MYQIINELTGDVVYETQIHFVAWWLVNHVPNLFYYEIA